MSKIVLNTPRTPLAGGNDPDLSMLFSGSQANNPATTAVIQPISIDLLEAHPDQQHWSMNEDELNWLASNIAQVGVLEPIQVQPLNSGKYRILAGHRRTEAARRANLATIPARILQVDDNMATAIFNATNLGQRAHLLPSEKAFAYVSLEKALAEENSSRATAAIAELTGDNKRMIQRYKRLLELHPDLLHWVDTEQIPMRAGEYISFMDPDSQLALVNVLSGMDVARIDLKQAERLREARRPGVRLTKQEIKDILWPKKAVKPEKPKSYKISADHIGKYFKAETKPEEIEQTICKALEYYQAYIGDTK
ncbi:ParB/RepB/Spo0J family partition protein [Pygmaiobacter massiliensis]|uniref:ParB/RepB/Spo0J family partition protein n=1 Tax=Pygmaiobacter massiliensis TaxID=1917873 RepID=UPI00289E6C2C|nr:ParB/RepB/Spo0J family partition protein [Pygmaiobacter massiliensis]